MIKKIVLYILTLLALLVAIASYILFGIDYNSVVGELIRGTTVDAKNIGKIELIKFPMPVLHVDYVKNINDMTLEDVYIEFSPMSLLMFKPEIKYIKISQASLSAKNGNLDIKDHSSLINDLVNNSFIGNHSVNIVNFRILDTNNNLITTLYHTSIFKNNSLDTSFFNGTLADLGQFAGSVTQDKNTLKFYFNITNDTYNFTITEDCQLSTEKPRTVKTLSGNAEYVIKDLGGIMSNILPELHLFFSKFSIKENSIIKFHIAQRDDELRLDEIKIDSYSFSGNGSISFKKQPKDTILVALTFPRLDISTLINQSNNYKKNVFSQNGMRLDFTDKLLKLDILINKLILNETNIFDDFKFSSELKDDVLNINDCSATMSSGDEFRIVGNVTQNSVRSIFDGKVYFKHHDINAILSALGHDDLATKTKSPFLLSSDLKFTLIDIMLQNFILQTDYTKVTGTIFAKFIGSVPHINTVLNFSSLDFSKTEYPIITQILGFAKTLTENAKDTAYLNKFVPIRTSNYVGNFDTTINDLKFLDYIYDKVTFIANTTPGKIDIKDLYIIKNDQYFSSDVSLIATIIGQIESLNKYILDNSSLKKISLIADGFLSKISYGDSDVNNFKFSITNDSSLLNINNLEADVFSGTLKIAGSILLDPYTITLVYALNSIDLSQLSKLLPDSINYLQTGAASMNGTFSTNGTNYPEFLYNSDSKSNILLKDIVITNFAVDDLIEKVRQINYDPDRLADDLNSSLDSGETKISDFSSNFSLNKGVVFLDKMTFNTKYAAGSAALAFNIYDFTLELSSLMSFYLPAGNIPPGSSTDNLPTDLKFKITGTVFEPKKIFDSINLEKILKERNPSTAILEKSE